MQIDNNGIQPDTLATAMLTDVNEAVTHQTEEEIVEEPFLCFVELLANSLDRIRFGSILSFWCILLVEMVRIWRLKRWGTCTTDADGICIVRNNEVVFAVLVLPDDFYQPEIRRRSVACSSAS